MKYRALFFGLTTIDIQYFVEEFPEANKKIKSDAPEIMVGGPAANAAVAFSLLNNGTHFISSIGKGPFSSLIREDFATTNLKFTDFSSDDKEPIIASVVTSANGDRNIFTHYPEAVIPGIDANELLVKVNPEIILLDGFYPEFGISLAKQASNRNIPVVLDCGSWKPQYSDLLKYTHTVICSEDFLPPACENTDDVFFFLHKAGVKNIAVSRGHKSILYKLNGKRGEVQVESCKVVDTLGAGDFLHGAFCYYFLQYNNFKQALIAASKLASFTCTLKGSRNWLKHKNMMYFM